MAVTWTSDELDKIGKADELEIASLRRDGTLRKPVTVWVVRYGDDLYVRSGYGRDAVWYRGAQDTMGCQKDDTLPETRITNGRFCTTCLLHAPQPHRLYFLAPVLAELFKEHCGSRHQS